MDTKVSELSVEQLKVLINEAVDMRLEERLGDPDVGMEVKPEVIRAIRRSRRKKATISASEAARHLGLRW